MSIEIIVCTSCQGTGVTTWEVCVNYHKRDYDTHSKTCKGCNGTGLQKRITTVSHEPHVPQTPTEKS